MGLSSVTHQVAQTHVQSRGDSRQRVRRDIFFTALNVTDVIAVKIGFLGQFLLAPFENSAMLSDVLAQDFSMLENFGHTPREPEPPKTATAYTLYFILAFFPHFPDCGAA
jgi:hypothetical protein